MKKDGRRRTAEQEVLMAEVSKVFSQKLGELGARKAAKMLEVSLASFYKYIAKDNLPRMEVLGRAHKIWGVKWPMMDTSDFLRTRRVRSAEQLAFSFIQAVQEADVEIVKVDLKRNGILQVKLKIHLPDSRAKALPAPA